MSHDVFISHSAKDKAIADGVCAALEANGLRCWIAPRDIIPGESWASSILKGISSSRIMVLIFSAQVNASAQVRREVERAVHHNVPIAPVRIQDVMPEGDMEYFLSSQHWMDALTPPFESHLRELALKVRALLTISGGVPPSAPDLNVDVNNTAPAPSDRPAVVGAPSHAGGMEISDSVIKGNVTNGSASVGNINIHVGQGTTGGSSAELEYEKCVMLTLRSGGSLESIRRELNDRRLAIGLPIRLAREIEEACLESCGRGPIQGRSVPIPTGPAGPDPLTRFFKSASESIASMFANPRPVQPGPVMHRPTPAPPGRPPPRPSGGPPPVPTLAKPPTTGTADESAPAKESFKEDLRADLKTELSAVVEKKEDAVAEGDKAAKAVDHAPAERKPPPLPAMPPPLKRPGTGSPKK